VLVLLDGHRPALARDLDRDDLFGEISRRHRLAGALLRAQRERVLVRARDLVFLGHVLAGLRHGVDAVLRLDHGIDEAPAQRGVVNFGAAREGLLRLAHDQRGARHRFDAAGDGEFRFAAANGARGIADGVEAGGAQPIEGDAGDAIGQAREQQRHARHVAVVFARLVGAAEHDLVERRPVDVGMALEERPDRDGGEVVGAHLGQRAAIAPDRSSHRITEKNVACVGHVKLVLSSRSRRVAVSARGARVQLPQH